MDGYNNSFGMGYGYWFYWLIGLIILAIIIVMVGRNINKKNKLKQSNKKPPLDVL